MADSASVSKIMLEKWIRNKVDIPSIERELAGMGYDKESINAHIVAFKRKKIMLRQTNAFVILAAGAVLGFISCVLTILNPFPSVYYLVLYGLTSVSVLLICAGLYLLFE